MLSLSRVSIASSALSRAAAPAWQQKHAPTPSCAAHERRCAKQAPRSTCWQTRFNAQVAMEKSFFFEDDFVQTFAVAMTLMDRWIDWQKEDARFRQRG